MLASVKSYLQFSGVLDTWQQNRTTLASSRNKSKKHGIVCLTAKIPIVCSRAVAASVFLVGLGYHSAVAVVERILAYLGQDLRASLPEHLEGKDDAGYVLSDNAATKIMED